MLQRGSRWQNRPTMPPAARQPSLERLTDAIYDAALDPAGWPDVMRQMHVLFASSAETFYLLDPARGHMRPLHIDGIAPRWLASFDEAYFAADNPWMGLSERLHQPGVVRTNERLIAYTRDRDVLYRSTYYNEWMRPQDLRYTIGNTLVREPGLIANVTLLRPPGMPTFDGAAVRTFEQVSRHMTRALKVGLRLEAHAGAQVQGLDALAALPQPAFLTDAQGRLHYANRDGEALLREGRGLCARQGRLQAARSAQQPALDALLRQCAGGPAAGGATEPDCVLLQSRAAAGTALAVTVHAVPLPPARAVYRAGARAVLLLAAPAAAAVVPPLHVLAALWEFTPAEARLAHRLAQGADLRHAAAQLGIGYGTARGYLKALFRKTGAHRQAELVRQLLATPAAGH